MEDFELSFGCDASEDDLRDFMFSNENLALAKHVKYDLSMYKDNYQRKIGCCTMASLVKLVERLHYEKTGVYIRLSVRGGYAILKQLIDKNKLEGSSMRNALRAAYKIGIPTEEMVPTDYTVSHEEFINIELTHEILANAAEHKIGAYYRVLTDPSLMRAAMKKYGPLYARFECGDTWYRKNGVNTWLGSLLMPILKPFIPESGHAVIIDEIELLADGNNKLWIHNSWSKLWCLLGRAWTYFGANSPTEVWVPTLNKVNEQKKDDKTPIVEETTWRKLMDLFRKIGLAN